MSWCALKVFFHWKEKRKLRDYRVSAVILHPVYYIIFASLKFTQHHLALCG